MGKERGWDERFVHLCMGMVQYNTIQHIIMQYSMVECDII